MASDEKVDYLMRVAKARGIDNYVDIPEEWREEFLGPRAQKRLREAVARQCKGVVKDVVLSRIDWMNPCGHSGAIGWFGDSGFNILKAWTDSSDGFEHEYPVQIERYVLKASRVTAVTLGDELSTVHLDARASEATGWRNVRVPTSTLVKAGAIAWFDDEGLNIVKGAADSSGSKDEKPVRINRYLVPKSRITAITVGDEVSTVHLDVQTAETVGVNQVLVAASSVSGRLG